MKFKSIAIAFLVLAISASAWAGDDIQTSVAPVGTPVPSIVLNGNQATQGTIQLFYDVTAFSFTPGPFARFSLNMQDAHITGASNAVYPATLSLVQNGSENLTLTPDTSSFNVTGQGWTGSTEVQISIPTGVPNTDGTDLVGNLNLSVPGSNHIGTVSTIQVHIRLVYPTACLRVFPFLTDGDFNGIISSISLVINRGVVKSSNPGQIQDAVLIVNTCSTSQSFDLKSGLDSRFQTNPSGNPGNAVFTYNATGELDPSSSLTVLQAGGTAQGQAMCLQNITVPAGDSFLAAVHSEVIKGQTTTQLGTSPFSFTWNLDAAGSTCNNATPNLDATPNPATSTLTF
jgi:hypothetical protein